MTIFAIENADLVSYAAAARAVGRPASTVRYWAERGYVTTALRGARTVVLLPSVVAFAQPKIKPERERRGVGQLATGRK